MTKPKMGDIVQVTWVDAAQDSSDVELSKAFEHYVLITRKSVGYYIGQDKAKLVLAMTHDPAHGSTKCYVQDTLAIPSPWVIEILTIKKAAK